PTLIECLTYRMESHTNSDDPTKYRDAEEAEHWKQFDPIDRVEKYLRSTGAHDDAGAEEVNAAAEALPEPVREAVNRDAETGHRLGDSGDSADEPGRGIGDDDEGAQPGTARQLGRRRERARLR